MHWPLIAFTFGNFSVAFWPTMPDFRVIALALALCHLLALLVHFRFRCAPASLVAVLLLGVLYGCTWGHWQLQARLPADLDRLEVGVTGRIIGLPTQNERRSRFLFLVEATERTQPMAYSLVGKRLLLSWYGKAEVRPGQRYRLSVRLRTPRGFVNPSGLDYSLWLLRKRIAATGYVRNQHQLHTEQQAQALPPGIDGWRQLLKLHINRLSGSPSVRGLMAALVIGDKSGIPAATWQHLVRTGTVHLAVVSGLHIGLAAAAGFWLGMTVGRALLVTGFIGSARGIALLFSFLAAFLYSLVSGFGLPSQRALVMLSVLLLLLALRRNFNPWTGLLWSCFAVSLLDPLAIMSAGFWLSFVAVASLLFWFVPRPRSRGPTQWYAAQLVILFGLAAVMLHWQHNLPLLAPIVNLIAVPWLGLAVVPLLLGAALLQPLLPAVASWGWQICAWQLQVFVHLIERVVVGAPDWQWYPAALGEWWLLPATALTGLLLLMPERLGFRGVGLILASALMLVPPPNGSPLAVTVLDVGQGLAALVRVGDKTLVYDTGPRYSDHFDAGSGILVPFLRGAGIERIDTLVVSHGDADHAGGLAGLLSQFRPERFLSGDSALQEKRGAEACRAGQGWRWQGVEFSIIWPVATGADTNNNQSCVLLIQVDDQRILLPGDIEGEVERQLLARGSLPGPLMLLVAPHHGSKTSSSQPFVEFLKPGHVVYSAGYRHHFGHPHPDVRTRYRNHGSTEWNTASSGALQFRWERADRLEVVEQRRARRRYWHPRPGSNR